jgi:multidrug resistance efflux pump
LIYTGEIEAVDEIILVTEVGGHLLEVNVAEGDEVNAGEPLLTVGSTILEAERAHALAQLQASQSQVELLGLKPSEEEIEAARAAVTAAEAIYQRALNGPTEQQVTQAQAQLFQAEAEMRRAQAAYDQLAWNPLHAGLPEAEQLQRATAALESAQAAYDALVREAGEEEIAAAYADVAAARAELRRLEDGPGDARIRAAEAQVQQAETTLYLAQLHLEKAVVRATIDGIVAQIYLAEGALALPGSPTIRLRSQEVHFVIALEESRLAQVQVGQHATLQVAAYPEQTFAATVTHIAPQVDPATRTVQVTVQPIDDSSPLLPGMYATVELEQP